MLLFLFTDKTSKVGDLTRYINFSKVEA